MNHHVTLISMMSELEQQRIAAEANKPWRPLVAEHRRAAAAGSGIRVRIATYFRSIVRAKGGAAAPHPPRRHSAEAAS